MDAKTKREVKWCLRRFIEMQTDAARAHYAKYDRKTKSYVLTDERWKSGHEYGFNIVQRAKKVLRAI